jgi:hypothetical protein
LRLSLKKAWWMLHISFGLKLGKQFTSYYFWLAEHPCEPFTLSILSVLFSLFGESQTRDYDIEHNDYDIEHNDYDIEHNDYDIEHSDYDIEHNDYDIKHNDCYITHNDYALCSMFPVITLEKSMLVGSFAFYDS